MPWFLLVQLSASGRGHSQAETAQGPANSGHTLGPYKPPASKLEVVHYSQVLNRAAWLCTWEQHTASSLLTGSLASQSLLGLFLVLSFHMLVQGPTPWLCQWADAVALCRCPRATKWHWGAVSSSLALTLVYVGHTLMQRSVWLPEHSQHPPPLGLCCKSSNFSFKRTLIFR